MKLISLFITFISFCLSATTAILIHGPFYSFSSTVTWVLRLSKLRRRFVSTQLTSTSSRVVPVVYYNYLYQNLFFFVLAQKEKCFLTGFVYPWYYSRRTVVIKLIWEGIICFPCLFPHEVFLEVSSFLKSNLPSWIDLALSLVPFVSGWSHDRRHSRKGPFENIIKINKTRKIIS